VGVVPHGLNFVFKQGYRNLGINERLDLLLLIVECSQYGVLDL